MPGRCCVAVEPQSANRRKFRRADGRLTATFLDPRNSLSLTASLCPLLRALIPALSLSVSTISTPFSTRSCHTCHLDPNRHPDARCPSEVLTRDKLPNKKRSETISLSHLVIPRSQHTRWIATQKPVVSLSLSSCSPAFFHPQALLNPRYPPLSNSLVHSDLDTT